MKKRTKVLCIFDGFGLAPESPNNCITLAKMPNLRKLMQNYSWTALDADGASVGQEDGLVGNSEVGHMNVGGLKLVPQLSYQITQSAKNSFILNKEIAPDQKFNPAQKLQNHFLTTVGHVSDTIETGQSIEEIYKIKNNSQDNRQEVASKIIQFYETIYRNEPELIKKIDELSASNQLTLHDLFRILGSQCNITEFNFDVLEQICQNKTFLDRPSLQGSFEILLHAYNLIQAKDQYDLAKYLQTNTRQTVHLVGLFSSGCIHSDLRHWVGAIESAGQAGVKKIILHIISDGRDSDKKSLVQTWVDFIEQYRERIDSYQDRITLGSLGGRYYAMDRDKNMDRVYAGAGAIIQPDSFDDITTKAKKDIQNFYSREKVKYAGFLEKYKDNLNIPKFDIVKNQLEFVTKKNYAEGVFDEHIKPIAFEGAGDECDKFTGILQSDAIWLINFRSDRMKQLTNFLLDYSKGMSNENYKLWMIMSMNDYGIDRSDEYYAVFCSEPVENTLAKTISQSGKSQLHIAETEKYNHVTYFFNGGQDKKWEGEDWKIIPSNKVTSHAQKPEMKAKEVTDYILSDGLGKYDYIIVNYANPDMVGHTGDIQASIQSMEFLDRQLGRFVEVIEKDNHAMILIADHGNMEFVGPYQENGKSLTDTEHNPNPVPCLIVDKSFKLENLEKSLESINTDHGINTNIAKIQQSFQNASQIEINQTKWLKESDIKILEDSLLPLWYASVLLLAL